MFTMFSLEKAIESSPNRKGLLLFTIQSKEEILSNYLAIISNKTLLLMPTIYTSILQKSSLPGITNNMSLINLCLIDKDKTELINIDKYENIKTIETQNALPIFLVSKIQFYLHIPRTFPNQIRKYKHIFADISISAKLQKIYEIDGVEVIESEQAYGKGSHEVETYILYHSDYKVILPKEMIEYSSDVYNTAITSISVNIFADNNSPKNIIAEFTNSHIEFSNKLGRCILLSLGSEIALKQDHSGKKYLSTIESFPIKKIHNENHFTFPIKKTHNEDHIILDPSLMTDTILPISCEKTLDTKIKEINKLTGHEIS